MPHLAGVIAPVFLIISLRPTVYLLVSSWLSPLTKTNH